MKAAFIYFAVRVFSAILGIAAIALYTRLVSPDVYGVFTLVLSAVTTVFALGYQWLRAGILRFLPAEASAQSPPVAAGVIGFAVSSGLVISATVVLWKLPFWDVPGQFWFLGLASALALAAMELLLAVVQARQHPQLYAALTAIRAFGALSVGAALAYLDYGAEGLLAGYCLAHGIPVLAMALVHRKSLGSLPYPSARLGRLVEFGWPMAVIGVGGAVIGISDRYMIAWLAGTAEAGIYAAPYDLAQRTLNVLMLSAFLSFSPVVFRAFDQGDKMTLDRALRDQSRLMLITGMPAALILACSAPLVSAIFFGPAFREGAVSLIPWIAAAAVIQGWNSHYLSYGYTLTHKVAINALAVTAGAALNLLLNFLLIPSHGALGAAIATLLTYALLFLASLLVTSQWLTLHWPVTDLGKLMILSLLFGPAWIWLSQTQTMLTGMFLSALVLAVFASAALISDLGGCRAPALSIWHRRTGRT